MSRGYEPYGTALALARLYEYFAKEATNPEQVVDGVLAYIFAAYQVEYEMRALGLKWHFRPGFLWFDGESTQVEEYNEAEIVELRKRAAA